MLSETYINLKEENKTFFFYYFIIWLPNETSGWDIYNTTQTKTAVK